LNSFANTRFGVTTKFLILREDPLRGKQVRNTYTLAKRTSVVEPCIHHMA